MSTQQTSLAPSVTSQLSPTKDGDDRRRDLDDTSDRTSRAMSAFLFNPCALGGQQSAQSSICARAVSSDSVQDTHTERRQEADGHQTDGRWDEMTSCWSSCTMRRAQREQESASSSSMCPCCDDVTQYGSPIQPSQNFHRHSFLLQRRDRLPAPFPLLQQPIADHAADS